MRAWPKRCGHPALGGHCKSLPRSSSARIGAATLISGGHCNCRRALERVMFGAAIWILGGLCNRSSATPSFGRGAATLIPGVHCKFMFITVSCPFDAATGFFAWSLQPRAVISAFTDGAATLILSGHCNDYPGIVVVLGGAATLIWVVIATFSCPPCQIQEARPPGFGWSLQPFRRAPHHPHRCGHPNFGWSFQPICLGRIKAPGAAARFSGSHCKMSSGVMSFSPIRACFKHAATLSVSNIM